MIVTLISYVTVFISLISAIGQLIMIIHAVEMDHELEALNDRLEELKTVNVQVRTEILRLAWISECMQNGQLALLRSKVPSPPKRRSPRTNDPAKDEKAE